MRISLSVLALALASTAAQPAAAQSSLYSEMQWRSIGPVRAGRARAATGVSGSPDVLYVGYDNGGVWRSTDYGSNWTPIFDAEPIGSIGAIAVAPSNPNIIYVGTGAAIIRPDLATGNGVYKSTDAGKTWTHLGLDDTQMIAWIDVDPTNPDRLFVAALGHPYGPNTERGIFRSTDGGKTFQKVLYRDEYTGGNDVHIDPSNPNVVYAALWQQQQSFQEGGEFGGAANGLYKSTDGGDTWKPITDGLPPIIEANLAIAPSEPNRIYAMIAGLPVDNGNGGGRGGRGAAGGRGGRGGNNTTGTVQFYRSDDAGEHWHLAIDDPAIPEAQRPSAEDPRPLGRIGGGDLPPITVDPKNADVVYSTSVVLWRTEDAGLTWSAVRGAPGGDDYQRIWIDPNASNTLLLVADQGAVVSTNRGESWSNWYNQPTAAVYHASADNSYPYRVCGGQQDSGSACVKSRSDDGEITFHDWHPVNIEEYGIAAPDPRDPDMVYGSSRTDVSLYNRRNGQTRSVGPDEGGRGSAYGRNVRTMPIIWSPIDSNMLFYASNVVWRTVDHAHSWTRISPDLARKTWAIPATAGQYASQVQVQPLGAITALSPSPADVNVIWAGTDDGAVQVTYDGGKTWQDVTPSTIKPWTRIYNMDAGHFSTKTAYIAANTMRIDDMNPHFFRTHDGGKTWTEIDNGITPGAVSNSIREDPRVKGLLYAGTETQVWFSTDDGDHWQSLRQNMPAISVRDVEVKDDAKCMCADLIAGTHGRGFWILDDVTPLRQLAAAKAATSAYLFKPITAVRIRFGTNEPTPWTPELPAGQNPPAGGIIDYYLAQNAPGTVTLDILDASGKLVRHYASDDPVLNPDPATDPAAYNDICKRTPNAPACGLPLYWPAPQQVLSTQAGMHRFTWDLHYEPIGEASGPQVGSNATGAVPHRTYPTVNAPWAPPGHYTVRLTVDGKHYSQPLTLKLDPRVKTPAAGLAQLNALTTQMYDDAQNVHSAFTQARDVVSQLDGMSGADVDALKKNIETIAPAPPTGGRGGRFGFFGRGGGAAGPATLSSVQTSLMSAAMAMQAADATPTAAEVAACTSAAGEARSVLAKWSSLRTTGIAAFNAKRKAAGQPTVVIH